jgi:hypothetical protein
MDEANSDDGPAQGVDVAADPAAYGGDGAGGRESVPVGTDRVEESFGDLLSRPPSDDVPVATGTYSIYHATNGSVVLVLEDSVVGLKTLAIPKAMVSMLGAGGRRRLFPFPFGLGGK